MPLTSFTVEASFGAGLLFTLGIVLYSRSRRTSKEDASKAGDQMFAQFQKVYLIVYFCGMFADWCQGPYVYALYESYGYSHEDNALLFVCGFGSSALFGTFIGSAADKFGRRTFALLYCLLYIISCMTKHFNYFPMLMLGRVTGGIATSLLFSVFDAWLVCEHSKRGFDEKLLGGTFSLAIFGNSITAILAGEVSQMAADLFPLTKLSGTAMYGGFCSPFDVAICALGVCAVLLLSFWTENYGQKMSASTEPSFLEGMMSAAKIMADQPLIMCCGIVCSFYEASMFIFVFQWTQAVTDPDYPKPPYGHIFAAFMVCCMLGSQIFSFLVERFSVEQIGQGLLGLAALTHLVPVMTLDPSTNYFAFLAFEMTVGIYFPMMGTLKGQIVPEESRSTIYNLYRMPLNVIVVGVLLAKVQMKTAFTMTSVMLSITVLMQTKLAGLRKQAALQKAGSLDERDLESAEVIGLTAGDGPMETEMPKILKSPKT